MVVVRIGIIFPLYRCENWGLDAKWLAKDHLTIVVQSWVFWLLIVPKQDLPGNQLAS